MSKKQSVYTGGQQGSTYDPRTGKFYVKGTAKAKPVVTSTINPETKKAIKDTMHKTSSQNYSQYYKKITEPEAYTYDADIYCEDCIGAYKIDSDDTGVVFCNDEWDTPQNCSVCSKLIDVDLTQEGINYILDYVADDYEKNGALSETVEEWVDHYSTSIFRNDDYYESKAEELGKLDGEAIILACKYSPAEAKKRFDEEINVIEDASDSINYQELFKYVADKEGVDILLNHYSLEGDTTIIDAYTSAKDRSQLQTLAKIAQIPLVGELDYLAE